MTTYTEQQQLTIARVIAYVIERHTGVPGWATESMAPWDHALASVAPDDDHHEWAWLFDSGFWYADDMLDGIMVLSAAETATWGPTDREAANSVRAKWPELAALVDSRNAMHPATSPRPITTLADAREQWAASGGDPERGPALEWLDDEGRVAWAVDGGGWRVRVSNLERRPNGKTYVCGDRATPLADLRLLADIIDAVEGALPKETP